MTASFVVVQLADAAIAARKFPRDWLSKAFSTELAARLKSPTLAVSSVIFVNLKCLFASKARSPVTATESPFFWSPRARRAQLGVQDERRANVVRVAAALKKKFT